MNNGSSLLAQIGMSGTDLGIGLAIMRLASLGALTASPTHPRILEPRWVAKALREDLAGLWSASLGVWQQLFAVSREGQDHL